MSSKKSAVKNRKALTTIGWMGIILIVLIIIFFAYKTAQAFSKSGIPCQGNFGLNKVYCVENRENCNGKVIDNLKCSDDKPFCCESSDTIGGDESGTTKSSGGGETEVSLSGKAEFYCKCRLEDDVLVPADTFTKFDAGKAYNAKKGTTYVVQARGTGNVEYCKITAGKSSSGKNCNGTAGPSADVTSDTAEGVNIALEGRDKNGGTLINSASLVFSFK